MDWSSGCNGDLAGAGCGGLSMWRGGVGLVAAVLALAGCKGTDSKPADKGPPGAAASRPKGKGPSWLDDMSKTPVAGTGVPKADSWANPKDPNFNVASEARGVLAGKVLDPTGHGARGVYIRIEPADAPPTDRSKAGAAIGILTDSAGYFMAKGLKPDQAYTLTAEAKIDGKPLVGVVQTRPPKPNLVIELREDVAPLPTPSTSTPVPPGVGGLPPPAPQSGGSLPPPTDLIPPAGMPAGPTSAPARPDDGSWSPGGAPATRPVPPTLPGTSAPPPGPTDPPAPRPENTATGPRDPWKPPALTLPGPPVPALPPIPPPKDPAPDPKGDGKTMSRPRGGTNFTLVDTLERPWEFASSRYGSLVLVEFLTTTCVPCKRAIPILVDLQSRYGAGGLQLIGVVCDDAPPRDRAALAAKYHKEQNLNYALFVEPGPEPGAVRDRFGVESYPTAVLLDGAGRVLWQGHPANRAALESAIRQNLGK
jgi:thiol-disulfide isomerase/thioredoxin